jgi:PhnB protein
VSSRLNPYLSFNGQAREAMGFYHDVFGGELNMQTYAEGGISDGTGDADRIMHAQLDAPNGMTLMGADTPPTMPYQTPAGVSISLSGDDDGELSGYWEKLSDGGSVTMPLEAAPWGDKFGMLTDRYGIAWMVNIAGPNSPA